MVGLGCGARSYTAALHYSARVRRRAPGRRRDPRRLRRPAGRRRSASPTTGSGSTPDEQRRRYVIQSLLSARGPAWPPTPGGSAPTALDDLPELAELEPLGLAERDGGTCCALTDAGLERSDAIGPWLYSPTGPAR